MTGKRYTARRRAAAGRRGRPAATGDRCSDHPLIRPQARVGRQHDTNVPTRRCTRRRQRRVPSLPDESRRRRLPRVRHRTALSGAVGDRATVHGTRIALRFGRDQYDGSYITSKMVPDSGDADRPLSLVSAGQSTMHETVATPAQTQLQPPSTEPGFR